MISRGLPPIVLPLLCLLSGGCSSWIVQPWPPYQTTAQHGEGAVLIKVSSDIKLGDFSLNSILLRWPNQNENNPNNVTHSQACRLDPEKVLNNADQVLLIPLRPGTYSRLIVRFFFVGYEAHYVDMEPDKQPAFTVEPGQVTVVGQLRLTAALNVQSDTGERRDFSVATKLQLDDSRSTKLSLLQEPQTLSEAGWSQWREAFQAAQRRVAAASGAAGQP